MDSKPITTWTWRGLNDLAVFMRRTYPARKVLQLRRLRAARKRKRRQRHYLLHPKVAQAGVQQVRAWAKANPGLWRIAKQNWKKQRRLTLAILYPRQLPTAEEVQAHRRAMKRAKKKRYYKRYPDKMRELQRHYRVRHPVECAARSLKSWRLTRGKDPDAPKRSYTRCGINWSDPSAVKAYHQDRYVRLRRP